MQQRSTKANQITFSWPRNNQFLGIAHDERPDIIGRTGKIIPIARIQPIRRPVLPSFSSFSSPPCRASSPLSSPPGSPPGSPSASPPASPRGSPSASALASSPASPPHSPLTSMEEVD